MIKAMRLIVLAAAGVFATCAFAQPAVDFARLMRERLKVSPVLKGEFEQTKTLKGFRNPLVSRGEFLVARGQGVWWHTKLPFESTLVVTRTRLFTRNADGSASDLVDAQAEPGVKQVNELIFSLLAADPEALADKFAVVAQPVGANGWTLALTPRDANLAKFLVRATLAGERDVQTVRIDEARGDTTQIRFSHQVPSAALSSDEAARLR
ncbi:LolA family protein [Scleromatobacter humisilvae]|uniref:Outer membrane lipoprotein carrier protein LolA n=1 Tax=Scleromatobacter humisilvae TaxID=2897159 RepID=A0A9X1YH28_9BURK|nr:outer membrane lipoprotein carrier protein LolA [Scleromatobacter humisilvae]MCK9684292.1 outer membrane lipoprotein carrier protein LolA [Scleromatobacter humisilvae]